ncbi:MAG: hypothetical protein ACK5QT_06375 [Oligoflexia bacterium]
MSVCLGLRWLPLALGLALLQPLEGRASSLPAPCDGSYKGTAQVGPYCAAAKSADKARAPQKAVGSVHAVVAGVCTAACAGAWAGGDSWCTGAALVGAAANLAISIDAGTSWANAITGLGGFGVGYLLSGATQAVGGAVMSAQSVTQVAQVASDAGKNANQAVGNAAFKRGQACFTAAFSAVASYMSFDGEKASKKSRDSNIEAARKLVGPLDPQVTQAGGPWVGLSGAPGSIGGAFSGGGVSALDRGASKRVSGDDSPSSEGGCDLSSAQGTLSCALAQTDSGLAPWVGSEEFKNTLEKLSGRPLDEVLSKESPEAIMSAALGNALNPRGQEKFAELVSDTRSRMLAELGEQSSVYAASGKGGAKKQGADFSYIPFQANEASLGTQPDEARFGGARALASSKPGDEENPAISLFVRVSSRYVMNREKVSALEWSTLHNRLLQGVPSIGAGAPGSKVAR